MTYSYLPQGNAQGRGPLDVRLLVLGVLCALAVGVPFLNKAIHIDDPYNLILARQILEEPLNPFGTEINWHNDPRPVFETNYNPPFLSYYLAPLIAVFGTSEVALHGGMLLFLILLGLATGLLAQRFADGSAWVVLFVLFSPAVVVSSNIMQDVPAMALSALGLSVFVLGADRDSWRLLTIGSLLVGLAIVTKYSSATILPAVALYPVVRGRWRYLLAVLPAFVPVALWSLQSYVIHGQTHVGYLLFRSSEWDRQVEWNFWSILVIAGSTLFLAPAALAAEALRRRLVLLFAALAVSMVTFAGLLQVHRGNVNIQYFFWAELGALFVFYALFVGIAEALNGIRRGQPRARDSLFLLVWAVFPMLFSVFIVPFQAVRHFIPFLVPLALLAFRGAGKPGRALSFVFGALLVMQTATAYVVAVADMEYADTYRQFAKDSAETLGGSGDHGNVWFAGHWGWQHYAQEAGFLQLSTSGAAPNDGDTLIVPERVHKGHFPPGLQERLRKVWSKKYPASVPIRTMFSPGRGFYFVAFSNVPYCFVRSRGDLETFTVYRVGGAESLGDSLSRENSQIGHDTSQPRADTSSPRSSRVLQRKV